MQLRSILLACLLTMGACSRQEAATPPAPAPTPAPVPATTAAPAPDAGAALTPELSARLVRKHSPVIGPKSAPVTLVEFLDPACGACAAFSPVVKQIQLLYPTEVRVVVRYATFHRGSDQAVRLLEAARRQGKFEPVLDALFERQAEWASPEAPNIPRIGQIATELGVNIEKARRDAALPEVTEVLRQDAEDLVALKVDRTPSFFVNGKPLVDFGAEQLLDLVRQEVVRAKG